MMFKFTSRLYAIIYDYLRINYDYIRLFAIILLQNPKQLYAIIPQDDYFTYCTSIISLIFFGMHSSYCNYYTRLCALFLSQAILYVLLYLRCIIVIILFRANYVHYLHYLIIMRIIFSSYYHNNYIFPMLLYAY